MKISLARRPLPTLLLFLGALLLFSSLAQAYTQICRCSCASNYTIFELPDDGLSYAQTCTNCTKKFCIAQDLDICKGFDESLVQAACFQRESMKEQFFIYLFIIITSLLLIYAALAPYFTKTRPAVNWRLTLFFFSSSVSQLISYSSVHRSLDNCTYILMTSTYTHFIYCIGIQ